MAEVDGMFVILGEKKRGKRTIIVKSESGIEREHLVPHGRRFLVHAGDYVKAGQSLIDGPLVPHDILRISGEEAVQQYLVHEVQGVYRSQRVEINDKHIEIIIARMLRKVQIESPGDTNLLPGAVMDKFEFRKKNAELASCLKITSKGDSDYTENTLVPKEALEEANSSIEALGGEPAKGTRPRPATAATQLLGITKAAVQSSSFISAASFQETTKVLTEAALAGKVDYLVGLKENVILGHLIPAGTGFRTFQESEVRIRPEALEALAAQKDRTLVSSFPLLESGGNGSGGSETANAAAEAILGGGSSDALGGGGDSLLGALGGGGEAPPPIGSSDFITNTTSSFVGGSSSGATNEPVGGGLMGADAIIGNPMVGGDDLTRIEGVGPKIAGVLNSGGVTSFAQLGEMTPDQVSEILVQNGLGSHNPTTWPLQAQLAAAGEWEKLKELQDKLDGGIDTAAPRKDDLTKIEGVGPKICDTLYRAGITTFEKLSQTSAEDIAMFLAADGLGSHQPATWPDQAKLAAAGEWDKLQVWQDELQGGVVAAAPTIPDDLTKIEGIGPKISEVLRNAGVTSFAILAALTSDDVREKLIAADAGLGVHNPTTWPAQAKMAADGEWEKLKAWQDELQGGV